MMTINEESQEVEPREIMIPEEAAAYLRVPVATLYQWRHRGQGPPVSKVGRHLRYRRKDVEGWLDEMRKTGH
jgi:excisionase family DNA binding protein